jgi:thymidine kinase
MAQLFFRYGAMNSGKSIEILKVAHNYEEQNKPVVIFTSAVDTRDEVGYISSRIGLRRKAIPIDQKLNVFDVVAELEYTPACVLVDEAQFLDKEHVCQLADIVDKLDIPVMAFGLKNDFRNQLFEGSKNLLLYADKIEEMKTICWFCHKKAIMNMRMLDGKPVYSGEQIQIGGNESYYPVCRKHYHHPPVEIVEKGGEQ